MGKTVGSILAVAAAVAVNVIPGVGQFLSAAIGATLASSVIAGITLYGLQAGVGLIAGGGSQKPETTETAIKTSRPPRVSAYGRSRLYGAYILYETAPNGTAVDVYVMHEGKIDGIEARYLGDETINLAGNTVQEGDDGRYRDGSVKIYTTDGSVPGPGLPAIDALLPDDVWRATHRGDGVVLVGVTAASVKADKFQETYPASSVPVPSIVARWQRCPDPAALDPLNEANWTWTENPVRQLLHYKLVREGPYPPVRRASALFESELRRVRQEWWNQKIAPTRDYWITAAAHCDELVPLKAGGTERRYRSAVAHKHTDEHKGPIGNFLATFDGWLAPRADGALVIYSGRFVPPSPLTDLIGPEHILSYSWEGGAADDDRATNEIICNYISPEHDYNMVEADAWRDEADIAARGKILSSGLEAQIPSHGQSRRLAKRRMARALARNRGSITTNIAGRHARGKRFIWLRIIEAGTTFYDGPAEIVSCRRAMRGGLSFEWVAADPNVDLWNPAFEEGEPAAIGNRVPQTALPAAEILSTTLTDSTLSVDVSSPGRADLTWYAQIRQQGATVWGPAMEWPDIDVGDPVELQANIGTYSGIIELQVAYEIGDGRTSPWSDLVEIDTGADGEIIYDGQFPI